jgi:hypothetical protein
MSDNRRRHPRFAVADLEGRMVFASQVEILNMSLTGMAIKVDRRLTIGAEYTVRLQHGERVSGVRGVVVWCMLSEIKPDRAGEGRSVYAAGLHFPDALSPALRDIVAFLGEHKMIPEQRLTGLRFHIDAPGRAAIDFPEGYRVTVVSLAGMRIETDHPLALDGVLPMEIVLPEGEALRFSGRVASLPETAPADGQPRFAFGIEFADMSAEDTARLSRYLDSL